MASKQSKLKLIDQNDLAFTPIAKHYVHQNASIQAIVQQYQPSIEEEQLSPSERSDPIGDEAHTVTNGLVHRYNNRVLLKITDSCAAYCRFCFRKNMINNGEGVLNEQDQVNAVNYIKSNIAIEEVIFSGGDPLTLSNRRLKVILEKISTIKHIKKIRFHTRAFILQPQRIDETFLKIIKSVPQKIIIAVHINHTDEITENVRNRIKSLKENNVILKSQSVLLRGINDNIDQLHKLFSAFVEDDITPYYLHHLDKAPGTRHFHVSIQEGLQLYSALKRQWPTLALPDYMLDIPGGHGKISLLSESIHYLGNNSYSIIDRKNKTHHYVDE